MEEGGGEGARRGDPGDDPGEILDAETRREEEEQCRGDRALREQRQAAAAARATSAPQVADAGG